MYNNTSNDDALEAAAQLLRKLAMPSVPGESVKSALLRVSRKLPTISYGRVRSIWYRDHRVKISADEILELRRTSKIQDEERHAADEIAALRSRLEALENKIETLERKTFASSGVEDC